MTKPIIGRYSNEQLRFTRNSGLKRSEFEPGLPRVTPADLKFSLYIIAALLIVVLGFKVAA